MQNLSNTKFLRPITLLLILILVAKMISILLWWYLPSEGVELNGQKSYGAHYQRVDFKNMLIKSKSRQAPQSTEVTSKAYSINSLVLKGLYGRRSEGFAIVAKKASPKKTTIISVGEVYAGYRLKEIELTQVIFTKSNKDYVLVLEDKVSKSNSTISKASKIDNTLDDSTQKSVSKEDIQSYSKDPSKIWKDIAIAPLKKAGKIVGFKVNRIKAGSKMASLGLKKGDVIIKANNIELKSFKDALKLYNKIDTIETISLVILRNNQEREIIYEIH
ncbi:hypothetical protein JHD47_07970 [Sulfurimonas sp. SAG-AH-194-L11]|nr:site-2 protease family protein [Sulfurimonas sp. SAG-AH-194-L11]MDF1877751.1 hypothetical protein [Sulfurimonas sp. SAG-AH-194-L11]